MPSSTPWRGEAHRVLPRFYQRTVAVENLRRLARKPPPAAEAEPPRFRGDALLVDRERLRGIPAIGRGVGGAIAGTNPLQALAAKEARQEADQDGR